MNKKHTFKKAAALVLGLALTVGATGCNFFPTDSEKDLAQDVASVNISAALKDDEAFKSVADTVNQLMGDAKIKKRDLIAYFLSTGYQYVDSYGYSYKDTFNMLLDGLVNREVMLQYVVAYYLDKTGANVTDINTYKTLESGKEENKKLAKSANSDEILLYKYFLTEGGEGSTEDYDRAIYGLKKSLNDALDSSEQTYILAKDEEHNHGETRTMPTNATTEKSDYYTTKYDIYTGRNAAGDCGDYERLDGSTPVTRKKAYNAFLANLQNYNLIDKDEDTSSIYNLEYYYIELASTLGQALLSKYNKEMEEKAISTLTATYVADKYEKIYSQQKLAYENDNAAFQTAIDGASDNSFVLYGKQKSATEKFGFVYNILLPFSTSQNVKYTEAKGRGLSQDALYAYRKNLLSKVEGKDLRTSWISEHDHADHSYWDEGKLYFFEDNFTDNAKYEKLTQYAGQYAFNGTVSEDKSEVKANAVDIDEFMEIFEGYVEEISGCDATGNTVDAYNVDLAKGESYYKTVNGKKEIDYSKFVYYTGKVDLGTVSSADFFNAETSAYKALSAVNELMFAYSTDTGCLNKYMGYSVSPYGTQFVKEFEYAAQQAVNSGVGSYTVCATDFGWHIVYTSFVYEEGYVYGDYNHIEAVGDPETGVDPVEGSFSYMFYESLKSTAISNYTTENQSRVLNTYSASSTTRFQDAYQDLLDLDNANA